MLPWLAIGAVSGAVSALTGIGKAIFGTGEETEMARRKAGYLAAISQARQAAAVRRANVYREGATNITRSVTQSEARARQAAKARAIASGHPEDVESFVIPAESNVAESGVNALENYSEASNRAAAAEETGFDQSALEAEAGYANRPIQPSFLDYLGETAGAAAGFAGGMSRLQSENDYTQSLQDDLQARRSTNQLNAYNQLWQNSTNRRSRLGY